jgi:hypothetical protein
LNGKGTNRLIRKETTQHPTSSLLSYIPGEDNGSNRKEKDKGIQQWQHLLLLLLLLLRNERTAEN